MPPPDPKPTQIPAVPAPPALTTPAFPSPYPDFFTTDGQLDQALEDALKAGPGQNWKAPVAIVALNDDGTRPIASHRGDETHYSASFVKVAAMYAAHELLETMNQLSKEYGQAQRDKFLADAGAYLNSSIMAKAATIVPLKGLKEANALPMYAKNYDATPDANGVLQLAFTQGQKKTYWDNLVQMIQVSSNYDAAWCIHRVGYGYLNGALTEAGFFDGTDNGIWLAGDYLDAAVPGDIGKWPYLRINSVNDKGVAQAVTVVKAAKLITLIADRKLVTGWASDSMMVLMKAAVDAGEVFINRTPGLSLKVLYNKLGVGPLKVGGDVCSEGSILEHTPSGRRFVVVWQNFHIENTDDQKKQFRVISHVVDKAIGDYVAATAPPAPAPAPTP
jgi:hypothetical protein